MTTNQQTKTIGERITFFQDGAHLKVIINQKIPAIQLVLIVLWGLGITFVTGVFFYYFANHKQEDERWFFLVAGGFASYFLFKAIKVILWRLNGKEIILVNKSGFSLTNTFGLPARTILLQPENFSTFKILKPDITKFMHFLENSSFVIGGDRMELTHEKKTYRFGKQLNETDTKLLFRLLDKHIRDLIKSRKKSK